MPWFALWSCLAQAGPPAAVVDAARQPVAVAPHGRAQVTTLLRGEEAFLGLLALDAGAAIPEHRDATGEYVWFLDGGGALTIDGVTHEVGPGFAVYMPADALVSFQAGPAPVRVLQVFAGPGPAAKYDGWAPGPTGVVGASGPFSVRCDQGQCAIGFGSREVVAEVWSYDPVPGRVIAPLDALGFRDAWLVNEHAGDGCPTVYRLLCLGEGGPKVTEPFGNCNELDGLRREGPGLTVSFPAFTQAKRKAVDVTLDTRTCAIEGKK